MPQAEGRRQEGELAEQPQPPCERWSRRWPAGIGIIAVLVTALIASLAGCGSSTPSAQPTNAPSISLPSTSPPSSSSTVPAPSKTPSSETPPNASPIETARRLRVGQSATLESTNISGQVVGRAMYTVHSVIPNADPDNPDWKPDNGRFVVIDVSVRVMTGSIEFAAPQDWTIQTRDGRVWTFAGSIKDPEFPTGPLSSGQVVRGFITYDMSAAPIVAVQLNDVAGSVVAEWV